MAHNSNKPGKEKRKPKKEKAAAVKPMRDAEVLEHVRHGAQGNQEHS